MDENPIDHPGVPGEVYHKLGAKTLWIFILERIHAALIFLLLTIAAFVLRDQAFLSTKQFGNLTPYVNIAAWSLLGIFVVILLLTIFISWLIYINYKFCLGEDSLKVKRGILNKEEIAMPYRQIQDVDIERDLAFQMMRLSRLIILTAGHEDDKSGEDESEGILPCMDKDLAEWLQRELLNRANVQKVVEAKPQ